MQRSLLPVLIALAMYGVGGAAQEHGVVTLTQTGCQFLEAENGIDRGYQPRAKEDCEAINERTGTGRLETAKILTLKPGRYTFRVTNADVPYALGFWIRGEGLIDRARLPSTSGGGLETGTSRDYTIDLVPGRYVYSCPLNPTPDYQLVVEG